MPADNGLAMNGRQFTQLVLLSAVWGGSFPLIRVAAPAFGPVAMACLRCALAALVPGDHQPQTPPPGSAPGLRYLRDRISVPRDMPLHAARRLRQALEATARLDPQGSATDGIASQGPPIPTSHRRDQDPRPFLEALPRL